MKKIFFLLFAIAGLTSCKKFLEEQPKSFLTPGQFYTTPQQIEAAVNGTYTGLGTPWNSVFVGLPISDVLSVEYLPGYSYRTTFTGVDESDFLNPNTPIANTNGYLADLWKASYYPLENCNSVIANLANSTVVDEALRNKYLGQAYFLRAWYYFQAVRLFGKIPLKVTPTSGLDSLQLPKAPEEDIYNQIVSDLTTAEQSGLPWTDNSGHVTMGAIKGLLAKVYLTMAGFPLQKGPEYYQKAFDKAKEVIASNQFSLFGSYDDLHNRATENQGEHIFMLQRDGDLSPNIMHYSAAPYQLPVTLVPDLGGGLVPKIEFYNSFHDEDVRKQEHGFFHTQRAQVGNPANIITFPPHIYKYWDEVAEQTGKYGSNIPLLRYADVLLICAEAKASADGGSTADADAIDAWYLVHHRAYPAATKPASITFDEVYKERWWELCFEFQTWFDMIRTRKTFDVVNDQIVDMIGYQAPGHTRAFTDKDLLLPIPFSELRLNPLLGE